jgi:hypothetical protein
MSARSRVNAAAKKDKRLTPRARKLLVKLFMAGTDRADGDVDAELTTTDPKDAEALLLLHRLGYISDLPRHDELVALAGRDK